ncbi:bifunctional 3,4-dihydroxy-2-butanone-4-phosphate synthase/GTP cyclohydrolase II [Salicibibacter halophilus]|uniref:Riboflavin biosynthesis protein RibBA n=1 Tax=Salicibibacter halophilus TaxID=2502791 RepID=A0A514LMN9_9BACI|nr:bifunctional 3,4-dihydroxy-2-butanone-4-phosphate synthase/GTP cyclohydrolase II [Salicibibacter halophilus]QDI93117.1 bifunctional 3,4-dihydroxy-2-butanone-4-phosphate synthase/GTP cyclohydrolase II [Salicibibacter halophilus]
MFDSVEKGIKALREGRVIIVCDDEDRENEGDLVALASTATADTVNFMAKHGRGLICAPITRERADHLSLSQMVHDNTDPHGTAFTVSVDYHESTTGISAEERAKTVRALASDTARAADFKRPGHIFPLVAQDGGVLKRAGHTEATVDLARIAGSDARAGLICEVMNADGTMARVPDLKVVADEYDIPMITIADLIHYRRENDSLVHREVETALPTKFGSFRAVGYTDEDEGQENIALVKGDITDGAPVLVRIHSECMTGDVFGSERCDCGPQLHAALEKIEEEGRGVLLYMRQEGRGIGLMNKLRAYKLQEEGYDTVNANEELGYSADLRDYGIGAQILRDLGIEKVRLLTNNPWKISGLEGYGIHVDERIGLQLPPVEHNESYLKTKFHKLGHLLEF